MAVLIGTSPGTDAGADFENASFAIGSSYVAGASGTVDTISIVTDSANTYAGTLFAAIYTNGAGGPTTKVGNTVSITSASGAGTRTSGTGAAAAVTSGTTYWIVFLAAAQFRFDLQSTSGLTKDWDNSGSGGSTALPATAPASGGNFVETVRAWASDAAAVTEFPPPILVMAPPLPSL